MEKLCIEFSGMCVCVCVCVCVVGGFVDVCVCVCVDTCKGGKLSLCLSVCQSSYLYVPH